MYRRITHAVARATKRVSARESVIACSMVLLMSPGCSNHATRQALVVIVAVVFRRNDFDSGDKAVSDFLFEQINKRIQVV